MARFQIKSDDSTPPRGSLLDDDVLIACGDEAAMRELRDALTVWLDATPPVLVESADGTIAATPIADPPRFTVALLRDVPDGARVALFTGDLADVEPTAARLNSGEDKAAWWGWCTVDLRLRDLHEDDAPCIVDTRPEVTP